MKFDYEYRTSDNKRCHGEIVASDRESAFRILRARGIKPGVLRDSPGVINAVIGKGKRWIAICILSGLVVVLAYLVIRRDSGSVSLIDTSDSVYEAVRHQVYGDPALLEDIQRDDFAQVFALEGERGLAKFAQPGVILRFKDKDWRSSLSTCLEAVLTNKVEFVPGERREIREFKQIVNGMKSELRRYLSDGVGTTASYVKRLEERQTKEFKMYNLAKTELERETDVSRFEKRNSELRAAGLPTVPYPEDLP